MKQRVSVQKTGKPGRRPATQFMVTSNDVSDVKVIVNEDRGNTYAAQKALPMFKALNENLKRKDLTAKALYA